MTSQIKGTSILINEPALREKMSRIRSAAETLKNIRISIQPKIIDSDRMLGDGKSELWRVLRTVYNNSMKAEEKCEALAGHIESIINSYKEADGSLSRSFGGSGRTF